MVMSLERDLNSIKVNSPLVMVPVLSKAMILIFTRASKKSPPLINNPTVAAFVSAQKVVMGVERTSAQGHALTRTTNAK